MGRDKGRRALMVGRRWLWRRRDRVMMREMSWWGVSRMKGHDCGCGCASRSFERIVWSREHFDKDLRHGLCM